MIDRGTPGWQGDAKWISGILLTVSVALAVATFSLAQLSERERAVPLLERVLRLTLVPSSGEAAGVAVREAIEHTAGEPLELLPGTDTYVDASELPGLDVEEARARVAAALAERVLAGGAAAVHSDGGEDALQRQLERALETTAPPLVRSALAAVMLPAGLDNGSRLANWRLQAQQNPAEPVQPVVGVFVRVPAAELEGLSVRQIGELVVFELADTVLAEGLGAAQELVTNVNLLQRLEEGAAGPARARLEELFETVLLGWDRALATRLEQARELEAAREGERPAASFGVATREELSGLSPEEATDLVLRRLAERGHETGAPGMVEALSDAGDTDRLTGAAPVIDALSEQANVRYRRLTWILGSLSLLFLLLLIAVSRGWGRLANPGIAFVLAASLGALVATRLAEAASGLDPATPPTSPVAQGALGYLVQLFAYVNAGPPVGAVELIVRNHLVLLAIGATLVVLSLLARLLRLLRPRRRSLI